jgi:hypothetical protein
MIAAFEDLKHETRIVWLVPIESLPRYVRESQVSLPRRNGLSRRSRKYLPGTIVGYSELHPTAPSDEYLSFQRRVFWLKDHDPYDDGGAPIEAVDPRHMAPGYSKGLFDDEEDNLG